MTLKINKSLAINAGTSRATGRIIVLHSTDDMEATAKDMATYEHRVWRTAETFVHFGVDDKDIYQVGTPGYKAWGAGNVNKYAPVQIELCEFADKARALKAYKRWIELAVSMAKAYDVPLTLDDSAKTAGFKSHLWCSQNYGGSDHGDPYPYLKTLGISKAQLAADLKAGHAAATVTTAEPVKETTAKPTGKGGTYTFTVTTNVRTAPSMSAGVVATYKPGQTVSYSGTVEADGYTWMKYVGASGKTRYAAQTGKKVAKTAASSGKLVKQSGTWEALTTVNVRATPSLKGKVVAHYSKGQTARYDGYVDADGIRWCSYIGASGKRRYVARRKLDGSATYAKAY